MDYYLSTTALQGLIQEFLIGVGPHPPHPLPPVAVAPCNFDDVSFKKSASLKVIYYPVDVSISVSSKRQASGLITVGGGGGGWIRISRTLPLDPPLAFCMCCFP